jgi:3,5-epimerase/4-reductase
MFNEVALNVRIRMPIVDDLKCNRNFVSKILEYPQICSIPNSMTYLPELLPILIDMLINYDTGTINLVNPGIISHNEILEMYKNKIDPSKTWENISIDQQNKILKSKRSNNWLCTKKLENNYRVNNIKKVINDVFDKQN